MARSRLADEMRERFRQWVEFNRWEADHPPVELSPGQVLASLSAIWSWLDPEVRATDPDPAKSGIQAMGATLAHLEPR